MNKLTLVTLISSALSAGAMAGDHKDKIAMSFADLDKNSDGYITRDEVSNTAVAKHFDTMNLNGNDMVTRNEFNTHVANNPSHFTGDVVASVQKRDNGVQEVDPKTVSAAGEDDIVVATESKARTSSMTAQSEANNMKDVSKDVTIEKDVDIDTDTDDMAMAGEAEIEKKSTMTVKTEQENMNGEKSVTVEKDVAIASDSDDMAMDDDASMEQESTMTVKSEQDNMGTEKDVEIEKDVDVEMEAEAATIAATEFDEIDTDQDGQLTKAEIANAADKVKFHEIDINNDEMVSRAEFDSYKRTDVESDMKDYDEE